MHIHNYTRCKHYNKTSKPILRQIPIMWYTQYCQDYEHLFESALKSHEYSNHPYWIAGGDVIFCDVWGTYIREYRNREMLNFNNVPFVDKQNTDESEFDINPKLTQSQ
ncbi:Uncharacterized protein FWK35_00025889 [Aphis craccivora]|uniref:Uncharacterized protein n=1 Tax=Aphis craccivora TaxID=307492 RepID=A0A6G0WDW3_APHCR|nr:Uncharacterized protein FWK35_00025889 [Aphis craccivora]